MTTTIVSLYIWYLFIFYNFHFITRFQECVSDTLLSVYGAWSPLGYPGHQVWKSGCHCLLDWLSSPIILSFLLLYLWALSRLMLHWSSAYSLSSFLLHHVSIWRECHSVFRFTDQWHFYFKNCDYPFQNLHLDLFIFLIFLSYICLFSFTFLSIKLGLLMYTCNPNT